MESMMAIQRLKKALAEIPTLAQTTNPTPEFNQWYRYTETSIVKIFGESSSHVDQFRESLAVLVGNQSAHSTKSDLMLQEFLARNQDKNVSVKTPYTRALESAASILASFIQEIETYGEDGSQPITPYNAPKSNEMNTDKVFVVHGRDEGTKQTVTGVIKQLGLGAVVLGDQPSKGRTVIEKFEEEAEEVGFAVVLLTPDDEGRLRGKDIELKPRARQNVIFELGYFARTLGRDRVCALMKEDVEIPSDYSGVMYISMDDPGAWKLELTRELREAGFDVDANDLM